MKPHALRAYVCADAPPLFASYEAPAHPPLGGRTPPPAVYSAIYRPRACGAGPSIKVRMARAAQALEALEAL